MTSVVRLMLWGLAWVLYAATACRPAQSTVAGPRWSVGTGSVVLAPPPGVSGPTNAQGRRVSPKVADDLQGAPPTHDWWSSLIWSYTDNPYSEPMFPHPLSLQAEAGGLQIGSIREPEVTDDAYFFPHHADLLVGVEGLSATHTHVVDASDWVVTAAWDDGPRGMHVTMGHGLPFVYMTEVKENAQIRITDPAPPVIRAHHDEVLVIEVSGRSYGMFAPRGATWTFDGQVVRSDLAGQEHFAVAALPDADPATIERFTRHASCYVTGSQVDYRWVPEAGEVDIRYAVSTRQVESTGHRAEVPLLALYRHQWIHLGDAPFVGSYPSARGEMKLLAASAFSVARPALGILPNLPLVGRVRPRRLAGLLKIAAGGELFPQGLEGTRDAYWEGKSFGRLAALVPIADELGKTRLRDRLLKGIKRELEDWFDGQQPRLFYYDETWKTVIGVPTIYYSDTLLNDHHFHYGYYIYAAAMVARYDRTWAERWAPMVELLIKDVANDDRDDPRFPYLRYFDPYAGHSWASGTTFFPHGNNQESSSEDLNFAASLVLWGTIMDRPKIRDTGLFLYAVGTDAVEQYWYDVDKVVYPTNFEHPSVGIVWGSGAVYDTWFSRLAPFVHGIQLTPMYAGAQWLGRRPDNVRRVLAHVQQQYEGEVLLWRDMFWMLESLVDPARASRRFAQEHWFVPEWGNSMAYLYHFIETMQQLGTIVPEVRSNAPMSAVFDREHVRTWVAYNPNSKATRVDFSDGMTLVVQPRRLGWHQGARPKRLR